MIQLTTLCNKLSNQPILIDEKNPIKYIIPPHHHKIGRRTIYMTFKALIINQPIH